MQLTITQTEGSLPFIDVIPNFGIGQLEGYNGVGKSLTVSVLELCSGSKPPMSEEAWSGLCDGMGQLQVVATELREVDTITWVLDGAVLARESGKDGDRPTLDWFVDVSVDGQAVSSLDGVRALFAVERINGDVGLLEQLALTAEGAVAEVRELGDQVLETEKMEELEAIIARTTSLLEPLAIDQLLRQATTLAELRVNLAENRTAVESAGSRLNRLDQAVRSQARLEEISIQGDGLVEEIQRLDLQIRELKADRNEVARQIDESEAAATESIDLRQELASATRSYKRASSKLEKATSALAEAMQVAKLADDDDPRERETELQERLDALTAARLEIDAGPAVLDLIDSVSPAISQAAAVPNLADQPLLSSPDLVPESWSVEQVADALSLRHEEIEDLAPPKGAHEVDEEIQNVTRMLTALARIGDLRDDRVRAEELLNGAQEKSTELSAKLDKASAPLLDELRERRRGLDEELSDLGGSRAVLTYRRDALGAPEERDALNRELGELLEELNIDSNDVASTYAAEAEALEREEEALKELRDREKLLNREHNRELELVRQIVQTLSGNEEFSWLREADLPLPDDEEDLDQQLQRLRVLRDIANSVDERFTDFRQAFPGLRASLEAVAAGLRGRIPEAAVRVPEVRRWLELQAASWFGDVDFRNALLGEGASDIGVDIESKQVSWRSGADRFTKPIEALSSGERAFALTQARLSLLQRTAGETANRLIALDEFGAFVSSNRVLQLSNYLTHWRGDHPSDQILIILPATQDYGALAVAADGTKAQRFKDMAAQLETKEWFIEEFEPA
jgi:hypothetical protein